MQKSLLLFATVAVLAFILIGVVPRGAAGAATPAATNASAVTKEILGQGAAAVAPDRVLILQRRTFAPGSDSGSHPAPGPTVLYVDSGAIEFGVDEGAALLTRQGETAPQEIAAGDRIALNAGDFVFYDEGVIHDVANPNADPAVTLESRLNPAEAAPATPTP